MSPTVAGVSMTGIEMVSKDSVLDLAQLGHEVAEAGDHRELAALEELEGGGRAELVGAGGQRRVAQDRQRLVEGGAGAVVGEGQRRGVVVVVEDLAAPGVDEGRQTLQGGLDPHAVHLAAAGRELRRGGELGQRPAIVELTVGVDGGTSRPRRSILSKSISSSL